MHVKVRNVNEAFVYLVHALTRGDAIVPVTTKTSRAGDVLKFNEPMTITFENPLERVLFN